MRYSDYYDNEVYAQPKGLIRCVVCNEETMDRWHDGPGYGDHLAVTTHPDEDEREPGNPLGTRGGYTEIRLRCSMGHCQRLVIANHKGDEYIDLIFDGNSEW